MHYYDHAVLSAHKYNCNINDTLHLHKLMDSSKNHYPVFMHRIFSHNTWFIGVITDLIGDTVPNTKTGGWLSTRDILFEHLREDHNGECPTIKDWIDNIKPDITPAGSKWFNNPRKSDKELLTELKNLNINKQS